MSTPIHTEQDLNEAIKGILHRDDMEAFWDEVQSVSDLDDAGWMTNDTGLELKLENGDVFLLTVKKVR